jgi:hypothetical protein
VSQKTEIVSSQISATETPFRLSGFPVVSGTLVSFVLLSGVFNEIIYAVYPSVPLRQCDNATGIIFGKFLGNKNTQVRHEVIKNSGTTAIGSL